MARRKSLISLAAAAAIVAIAVVVAGCGGGGGTATAASPATTTGGTPATVGVASAGNLGHILVDSQGRTLYLFGKDSGMRSACTGTCATEWPPLRAGGHVVAGAGLTGKLSTTKRSDGAPQVTYNGHPLYQFAADQNPGDTAGQGLTDFGGPWYVVSPAGSAITTSASTSSGGGTSGY